MRNLLALSAVCCLLAAPAALWAQGEFPLKYQEAPFGDPLTANGGRPAQVLSEKPADLKVPKGLSEKVTYFALPFGDKKVFGIIDPNGPKLFIDTAGSGDLSSAKPLEPAKGAEGRQQIFGPMDLTIPGSKDPTTVKVRLLSFGGQMVIAFPAGYLTGEVKLGDQTYKVALVGGVDGPYGKTLSFPIDRNSRPSFDIMAIDLDQDGKFSAGAPDTSEIRPLFPMIQAKGAYYRITVAPNGSTLKLEKAELKMGTLETGLPDATLTAVGEAGIQQLTGSDGKYQVPAGKCCIIMAKLTKTDKDGAKWLLSAAGEMGKLADLEVKAGETLKVKLGPPLVMKTNAAPAQEGTVSIGFALEGQSGETYAAIQKVGVNPVPPKAKVLDEKGNVLGQGNFEYG